MTENLRTITENIETLRQRSPINTTEVKLLAVSKTWSVDKLEPLITAGQRCFGENYLQEALTKITALQEYDLEWHFIGPIQSNKTRDIAENFDWAQTIDRLKIAKRLNDQRPTHLSPLNICIQVNIDKDNAKSGVLIDEVFDLATEIQPLKQIQLRGLMVLPAKHESPQQQKISFDKAKTLFDSLQQTYPEIDTLSMGMSHDMEAAILAGSTMVRIGTALFGQRQP